MLCSVPLLPELEGHVVAAYSLYCDREFAHRIGFWTPGRTGLEQLFEGEGTLIALPADQVALCRLPGRPVCFARPALVPCVFGAAALPLDADTTPPPRIVGDLALERGFDAHSSAVNVLREHVENYGGLTRLGLFEAGDSRLFTFVQQTNPAGGRQSWDEPRFLVQGTKARRAEATAETSIAEVFRAMYERSPASPRSRYRLRLIAAIEQPWGWNEWLEMWNEWSQAC